MSPQIRVACMAILLVLLQVHATPASQPNQQPVAADQKTKIETKAAVAPVDAKASSAAAAVDPNQAAIDAMLNSDEYVQIKPEEMANDKEFSTGELMQDIQPQSAGAAEHKSSADDELNAHLAQDSIAQLESRPYPATQTLAPAPRVGGPMGGYQPQRPYGAPSGPRHPMPSMPRPGYGRPPHGKMPPPPPPMAPYRPGPMAPRLRPTYSALKGKLTGINHIINQYPHPAPGHPHQAPKHLPRGAAAGYAAFKEFVKAHASKYKQVANQMVPYEGPSQGAAPYPGGHPPKMGYPKEHPAGPGGHYGPAAPSPAPYGDAAGAKGPRAVQSYGGHGPQKTKVTVAQAFIPHLSQPASSYGESGASYGNPMLSKLYGGHAPQGVGKPEYNKDFGMVIHYPQATVYTEPMTVDQLHKLTGGEISHIIENLQYNLAHGHRDESSMIRANNKHHLGHGLSIHAKEYYAPGKGGHYVPTTAAVISASGKGPNYGPAESSSYQSHEPATQSGGKGGAYESAPGGPMELGSGYDKVRQAAAAGSAGNHQESNYNQQGAAGAYGGTEAATGGNYPSQSGGKYQGEPLASISHLLGSELNTLYGNLHEFAQSAQAKRPLVLAEPIQMDQRPKQPSYGPPPARPQQQYSQQPQPGYGAGAHSVRSHGPKARPVGGYPHGQMTSNRYQGRHPHPHPQPAGYGGRPAPQRPHHGQSAGRRPYQPHPSSYQNAQQVAQEAQAQHQQMLQLLHEIQASDEHYNSKSQPMHSYNQGYPHKVMQKHQQQAAQAAAAAADPYGMHDGPELPQGAHDQIGEISELIEALKGNLEGQKPESESEYGGANKQQSYGQQQQPAKVEHDVKYLTSALGQAPSYAMQVPVAHSEGSSGYEAVKKVVAVSEQNYQQQQQQQHPQQQQQAYQQAQPQSYQPQPQSYHHQTQSQSYHTAAAPQPAYQQPGQAGDYSGAPALEGPQQSQQDGYGRAAAAALEAYGAAAGYGAPLSHQQAAPATSGDYSSQQQQSAGGYQSAAPSGASSGAASYGQPELHQAAAPVAPASPASYSSSEHTQVINHLVPANSESGQYALKGYGSASAASQAQAQSHEQPGHQIAIAAPTDSQYQQAQSLSSFVDSLPTDYQELLRQPALPDSNTEHLAIAGHEAQSSSNVASHSAGQQLASDYAQQATEAALPAPLPSSGSSNYGAYVSGASHQQQSVEQHAQASELSYQSQRAAKPDGSSKLHPGASSPGKTSSKVTSSMSSTSSVLSSSQGSHKGDSASSSSSSSSSASSNQQSGKSGIQQ